MKYKPVKRYEETFNLSNYDEYILNARKSNKSRISTILKYIVPRVPLDEIVILSHILNILNENNLAVSRKEVRTAFNCFYRKTLHGDKQGYLNYLYKTFKIKVGTITCPENFRKTTNQNTSGSKKDIVTVTSEPKNAHFKAVEGQTLLGTKGSEKNAITGQIQTKKENIVNEVVANDVKIFPNTQKNKCGDDDGNL